MARQYERGEISVLELKDYCEIASKLIQYTPKEILFERVGASVMDDSLIAPMWSTKRWPCINEISRILEQNGAQGSMLGDPFVYVSGFGKFINLSYETSSKSKAKYGYLAYLVSGVKDFFKESYMYEIEFTINGVTKRGKYSLGVISNANRIAGINNFYKDVKLDDDTFEVLFCSIRKRSCSVNPLKKINSTGRYC